MFLASLLTNEQNSKIITPILELLKQGESGRKIANLYGVSEAQISRIKNKVNWRFISEDQNGN